MFSAEYDGIVGVFSYRGKKAYYAVNYSHPKTGKTNKFAFDLEGEYEVYAGDEKLNVAGKGEITLDRGCGAFFLPKV